MYRTRDWRRAQTNRIIEKRVDIIKNVWTQPSLDWYLGKPHRLAKYNLNCGCSMCQGNKSRPNDRFALDNELEAWYDN